MKIIVSLVFSLFFCFGAYAQYKSLGNIDESGMTIEDRIMVPEGYVRPPYPDFTFQYFLKSLPMKSADAKVVKYDGFDKFFESYSAVIDLQFDKSIDKIHSEHLIQYLRGMYLHQNEKFELINFSTDDNRDLNFQEYGSGMRWEWQDSVWVKTSGGVADFSENSFLEFMEEVYSHSTTNGLATDTRLLEVGEISVGDVFIQPASGRGKGHSVIIMDMAVDPLTGERLVLLGQGFAPTQDMHILKNPYEEDISPWYRVKEDDYFFTTIQWTFRKKHCRRFIINANAQS